GFGSMLRALGAQIEKTTNREACRDLSGRRLRDVNHEKAMAEWVKQQAEREAEKEQRRLERLQRKLAEPKHFFTNPDYQQQCHEMAERLEDSVLKGMQASSSKVVSPETNDCRKRPNESEKSGAKLGKRKCFWMGVEGLADPESSDDGDSEDDSPSMAEGSWQSTGSHVEKTELTSEWPSSSEDSTRCSSTSNATEKSQEQREDLGKDLPEKVPSAPYSSSKQFPSHCMNHFKTNWLRYARSEVGKLRPVGHIRPAGPSCLALEVLAGEAGPRPSPAVSPAPVVMPPCG
ncbi:UPF0667 protein C1orf55, partial [Chelonia mydas]